jgi:hypothetical protein
VTTVLGYRDARDITAANIAVDLEVQAPMVRAIPAVVSVVTSHVAAMVVEAKNAAGGTA